jgi:hypothetical protein
MYVSFIEEDEEKNERNFPFLDNLATSFLASTFYLFPIHKDGENIIFIGIVCFIHSVQCSVKKMEENFPSILQFFPPWMMLYSMFTFNLDHRTHHQNGEKKVIVKKRKRIKLITIFSFVDFS